ncbi:hypothetical protein Tco_1125167 [Tanacetum coccineum]|uniref:Uncharacterized protein n=1 Tax=Tanacetum coccineum TaxID=301880 RepID=A0ABQ5J884_9ASTR
MTPAQALKSIEVMAEHSHNWYDGATTRESINDSSDNVDTNRRKENIHAIQVSCRICKEAHLTKECPLKKEDKAVEQRKYIGSLQETIINYCDESIKKQAVNDEWIRKFIKNTDLNLRALDTTTKNLQVKTDQLTQMVLANVGERVEAETKIGKKDMKEPVPRNFLVVQPYVPPTLFPGHLKKQKDNPYKTRETDVERLRQILTPTIHALPNLELVVQPYMPQGPVQDEVKVVREEKLEYDIPLQNGVMQLLTSQTVHITSPDVDYVAPAANPILDKHLNEFDMTRVDKNGNFVEDIKELSIKMHIEWKHFKFGLAGYHADDDNGLELWMLLMEADLKHGLEHVVFSSS